MIFLTACFATLLLAAFAWRWRDRQRKIAIDATRWPITLSHKKKAGFAKLCFVDAGWTILPPPKPPSILHFKALKDGYELNVWISDYRNGGLQMAIHDAYDRAYKQGKLIALLTHGYLEKDISAVACPKGVLLLSAGELMELARSPRHALPQNILRTKETASPEAEFKSKERERVSNAIRGHVGGLTPRAIWGWAYCGGDPDDHLVIEIVSGDDIILKGVADILRPDLKEAGFGNGDHGFFFDLSRNPLAEPSSSISVYASTSSGARKRLPSPAVDQKLTGVASNRDSA